VQEQPRRETQKRWVVSEIGYGNVCPGDIRRGMEKDVGDEVVEDIK